MKRFWRGLFLTATWIVLVALTLWAIGALYFDFPVATLRKPAAIVYALAVLAIVALVRRRWQKAAFIAAGFIVVLGWWLTLQPSNDRDWQSDVAQTAWAEIDGDRVTLHNVRNNEYRTETDYTLHWETRTVDLSRLRGIDLFINYWGPEWMAHPIVSFQFDDALPVCFSIEVRLQKGEEYSSLGGIYRYAELIYVCADERDVVRLRSNFRSVQDVYLYRTTATPPQARERFVEYLRMLNSMREHPRWYNALTTNCTTAIRAQRAAEQRLPWDWRILLNGYLDQMLYEHGTLAGDLPFAQLKEAVHVNAAARVANDAADFSARIRAGRPGFSR
ncbi:MAG TPA: DUF4105 domain-containing protein [Chthoniobacterales bacterium]